MKPSEVTLDSLRTWPLPDPEGSESKEDRGRVLVVGGSRKIPGAALLAANASLRAGAGKLQIGAPIDIAAALAIAVPEAKVMGLKTDDHGEIAAVDVEALDAARNTQALLVGPGMLNSDATHAVAAALLALAPACILDAGAMSAHDAARSARVVITPHFGEMAALLKCSKEDVAAHPDAIALEFAAAHDLVVVLKSPTTYIATPDGSLWVHRGGSVGLGVSGSGDVLAGVIAGLIAQGAPLDQAAVWGVTLHGAAGAALAHRIGRTGFFAREIADEIPRLRYGQD